MRGTTVRDVDSVIDWLANYLGDSVVVLPSASNGYREAFQVGPVRVAVHPERPDMLVQVDVSGSGCEELGLLRLTALWQEFGLRLTRLDLALDGCDFTPADLRDHWQAGRVRTRCKVPENARADRQWRNCKWTESATGDTFSMGSRTSLQYARCYDSRGFTRFELELHKEAAQAAGVQVFGAVQAGKSELLGMLAIGWVRRFVDFVEESEANMTRRSLLPFWEAFICGAEKARVTLTETASRTVEQVRAWVEHQVAPALAILRDALGSTELWRLIDDGRSRWRPRHLAIMRGVPCAR